MDDLYFTGNSAEIAEHAAALTVFEAWKAVSERGMFSFVLSGGRSPIALYRKLASGVEQEIMQRYGFRVPESTETLHDGHCLMPWKHTRIFWGDERCVPPEDAQSNYRTAKESLLDHCDIDPGQIFRMPCGQLDPAKAAQIYEQTILSVVGCSGTGLLPDLPVFDLILLGLGEDGHTASLFADDREALEESRRIVIAVAGTQGNPPVPRLTMTLHVINRARTVFFITEGKKRAAMTKAIVENSSPADWPAGRIRPVNGRRYWFISIPSTH